MPPANGTSVLLHPLFLASGCSALLPFDKHKPGKQLSCRQGPRFCSPLPYACSMIYNPMCRTLQVSEAVSLTAEKGKAVFLQAAFPCTDSEQPEGPRRLEHRGNKETPPGRASVITLGARDAGPCKDCWWQRTPNNTPQITA